MPDVTPYAPLLVDADVYRRLIEADTYNAQGSIDWVVRQVAQFRDRIADGQEVVLVSPDGRLLIGSNEALDDWASATLPSTWVVMQANLQRVKAI